MTYKYALIEAAEIDQYIQKAAHMALASARKELRLPMVRIKWFNNASYVSNPIGTFEDNQDIRGQFTGKEPNTIYVMAWQSVKATQETVYHEVFHLCQFRMGFGFGEHSEGLAQDYTKDMMKRMSIHGFDEETYLDHMVGKDWSVDPKTEVPAKIPAMSENKMGSGHIGSKDGYHKKTHRW